MSDTSKTHPGFFVDWDGKLRRVDQPGEGLRCEVDHKAKYVMVFNKHGGLDHESTWYPDEAAVARKGIKVVHAESTTPILISSND